MRPREQRVYEKYTDHNWRADHLDDASWTSMRPPDRVTWSTQRLVSLLEEAARRDLGIFKIHSHPGGYSQFSSVDDESDADLFNSVFGWTDSVFLHAGAVMLPYGRMFGRAILQGGSFQELDSIMVPGDDQQFWAPQGAAKSPPLPSDTRATFGLGHDTPVEKNGRRIYTMFRHR